MNKVHRYETLPVEIEAIKFTEDNIEKIKEFTHGLAYQFRFNLDKRLYLCNVKTLEGVMTAEEGDFIIKGTLGEFYTCKPEVFHKKYKIK